MSSPSSVITLGYGSWGSVNLLPTLGYGIGSGVPLVYGPMRVCAVQVSVGTAVADPHIPALFAFKNSTNIAQAVEVELP